MQIFIKKEMSFLFYFPDYPRQIHLLPDVLPPLLFKTITHTWRRDS